eukprot:RCo005250
MSTIGGCLEALEAHLSARPKPPRGARGFLDSTGASAKASSPGDLAQLSPAAQNDEHALKAYYRELQEKQRQRAELQEAAERGEGPPSAPRCVLPPISRIPASTKFASPEEELQALQGLQHGLAQDIRRMQSMADSRAIQRLARRSPEEAGSVSSPAKAQRKHLYGSAVEKLRASLLGEQERLHQQHQESLKLPPTPPPPEPTEEELLRASVARAEEEREEQRRELASLESYMEALQQRVDTLAAEVAKRSVTEPPPQIRQYPHGPRRCSTPVLSSPIRERPGTADALPVSRPPAPPPKLAGLAAFDCFYCPWGPDLFETYLSSSNFASSGRKEWEGLSG